MINFVVYILKCADDSFYIGHTDDIRSRLAQHDAAYWPHCFTANRLPVKLVWMQTFATRDDAFKIERRLKKWSRNKKEALIAGDWDALVKLSNQI